MPTDKIPGIEINIACIILFIDGTIDNNLNVLNMRKALKTEKDISKENDILFKKNLDLKLESLKLLNI